jgi:hypothetical protein
MTRHKIQPVEQLGRDKAISPYAKHEHYGAGQRGEAKTKHFILGDLICIRLNFSL